MNNIRRKKGDYDFNINAFYKRGLKIMNVQMHAYFHRQSNFNDSIIFGIM